MSLSRHFYNTADRKLSIALNKITEEEINTSVQSATWKLESIIRNFNPKEHQAISSIEKAIEKKRLDIQKKHPENARIYILEGMLHERMNKHDQALASYQTTRMHFQHCWHAYLYPATLLQNSQRYEESKNLLIQMVKIAANSSEVLKPSQKLTGFARASLAKVEQKLEEQSQIEQKQLAKEMKKTHALEALQLQQQVEEYKQHPTYNPYNILSNPSEVWDKIKSINTDNMTHTKNYAGLANKRGIFASENQAAKVSVQASKQEVSHRVTKHGKQF